MIYVDTSALLKLVFVEQHSEAMRAFQVTHATERFVSSVLLAVEVRRSAQRISPRDLPRADLLLDHTDLIDLTRPVVETASRLGDPSLRSLDAIHVATALLLEDELTALVTYDKRMLAAARSEGLPVRSPGLVA